ncbi:MAG: hypothetical protein RDV41_02305, partial [Planctomycetota bacterium]|nr:hypothetical protein [Planctomycetota bacterium]
SGMEEAFKKIETGLFDILFVSFTSHPEQELAFIKKVNALLPGLPVMAIVNRPGQATEAHTGASDGNSPASDDVQIFRELVRPLRVAAVADAALHAIAKLQVMSGAPPKQRGVPVAVTTGERTIQCVACISGEHGVLVESFGRDQNAQREFEEFFSASESSLMVAEFHSESGNVIKFKAQIAFTEHAVDKRLRQVGLRFSGSSSEENAQ